MSRWGLLVMLACACESTSGDASDDAPPTEDGGGGDAGTDGGATVDAALPDAQPGVGEPPELMGITLAHNQVRQGVQTSPALPALVWDAQLAATAAAWVATCTNVDQFPNIHDHNPGRSQGHPYYVGENIYASSGTANPIGAVNSWASEVNNYNYANNTCAGVCGHYTQIVWRTTLKLGCARGQCSNIPFGSTIVCNYGPGGNVGGARPY